MNKVTSTDIKKALAEYHQKDYFITECKNGSTYFPPPQGLLKFDGLAITRSYTQPCIKGYEIKVSRGDFQQDAKWHLYLQYCNEFYFVVPNGLIKKDELPDNVGLIYYYHDTGFLKKKKKALYREIEEPVGVYKYIIFSRLEQERIPFYEERAQYAEDFINDKAYKRNIGKTLGSKMAKELSTAYARLENLENVESKIQLLDAMQETMRKHGIGRWAWKNEDWIKELDVAIQSSYPTELEYVKSNLESALRRLNSIEEEYSAKSMKEEKEDGS